LLFRSVAAGARNALRYSAVAQISKTASIGDRQDYSKRHQRVGFMKQIFQIAAAISLLLAASQSLLAGACVNFDATRSTSYAQYIRLVADDIKSIERGKGDAAFNASIQELSSRYARMATAGDAGAVRKLIGIGLFTTFSANREPLDARLDNPANRQLAKEMIEVARGNLASDQNRAGARNLFESISQVVLSCLSQP
jgi:hypothetical protein